MRPDRSLTICGIKIEQYYWAGKDVVYIDNQKSRLPFDEAVAMYADGAFITHSKECVTGERLIAARAKVADDWARIARAIRSSDDYGPHVTTAEKDEALRIMLAEADAIRAGNHGRNFTIWQRINTELTGECVALLPK